MARFNFEPLQFAIRSVIPLPAAFRARMLARERHAMRLAETLDADTDLPVNLDEDDIFIAQIAGPGWYASSWELTRGLDVREGLPADAKLHEWLEVCLMS